MSSSFVEQSEAFLTWFRSHTGATIHPSLRLVDLRSQGQGRGLITTVELPTDTALFTVPKECVLSVETSDLQEKIPGVFDGLDNVAREDVGDGEEEIPTAWLRLMLVLVYEHLLGPSSRWKPYLDILPTAFDTPMFWSEDELAELQGSELRVKHGKEEAENLVRKWIVPVVSGWEEGKMIGQQEVTNLALRMGSLVMGYAFDLDSKDDEHEEVDEEEESCSSSQEDPEQKPGINVGSESPQNDQGPTSANSPHENGAESLDEQDSGTTDSDTEIQPSSQSLPSASSSSSSTSSTPLGMIPMADMLNADAEFNSYLCHPSPSSPNHLTMYTLRPLAPQTQILNYYGPLSNSELLRRYGYTSPLHERYDTASLSLDNDILPTIASYFDKGVEELKSLAKGLQAENGEKWDTEFVLERETGHPSDEGLLPAEPAVFKDFPPELESCISALISRLLSASNTKTSPRFTSTPPKALHANTALSPPSNTPAHEPSHTTDKALLKTYVSLLRRILTAKLDCYHPTTLDEDLHLLSSLLQFQSPHDKHFRTNEADAIETRRRKRNIDALRVRIGEKKLLIEARSIAEQLLRPELSNTDRDKEAEAEARNHRAERDIVVNTDSSSSPESKQTGRKRTRLK
ncbi:MAG: hypothetical protein Q9227_001717 [Pyrenula ochraceoflavens]